MIYLVCLLLPLVALLEEEETGAARRVTPSREGLPGWICRAQYNGIHQRLPHLVLPSLSTAQWHPPESFHLDLPTTNEWHPPETVHWDLTSSVQWPLPETNIRRLGTKFILPFLHPCTCTRVKLSLEPLIPSISHHSDIPIALNWHIPHSPALLSL